MWRIVQSAAVVSVGLYAVALAARIWAIGLVSFPLTEGSAYYVAVARNLVAGRGLVIDAIWSYATPPLTLPRPAFELWQPMASFIAAVPVALFQQTFGAAQLGGVALGALLAPLAWLVARDTARRLDLPQRRERFVALGAGALAGVTGPLLLATAIPDSTLPFTVLGVAACLVMPAAVRGDRPALIGLGVLLGAAYLTRLEAVWLGLAFLVMLVATHVDWRTIARRSGGVAAVGAILATPWLLRNLSVFGTPFPGQVADNIFLTRNEQIFWYSEQPTLDGFLAQGLPQLAINVGNAAWHNVVNVLLVPAAPVVAVALATLAAAFVWKRAVPRAAWSGSLAALFVLGAITFAATTLLFPVATLWGTFEHAAGPLLIGLAVAAVVGGDAFVAWLVNVRGWQRSNTWMAPMALVALTLPLTALHMSSASRQATTTAATVNALPAEVMGALHHAGVPHGSPIITDRPIWVSEALLMPALALPDEPVESVLALARRFGARAVVLVEGRGRYPAELRVGQAACFTPLPATATGGATVFLIDRECAR
ncbi:MAG: glycosyltransferase family 39 protein [Chloroflexota bacterium]